MTDRHTILGIGSLGAVVGRADLEGYLAKADNLSGLANLATSRTNLGLGTAASPVFTGLTISGLTVNTFPVATTGGALVNSGFTTTNLASGVYTPTLTNVANLDGSTAFECQWLRVGNTVTVSGRVNADPTTAGVSTQLGISLPVASNLGASEDCAGVAASAGVASESAGILGDVANDRAQMQWITTDTGNHSMFFHFTYQVI